MLLTRFVTFSLIALAVVASAGSAAALIAGQRMPSDEIAYMSYERIMPDIYLVDVHRGLTRNLTDHPAYDAAPAWSPDGMYIAFLSDRDGGPRVYVIGANGHGLRMLTPEPGNFTAPRWSSDGTRIAFFRVLRLGRTLITVDLASGRLEETDNEVRLAGPLLLELGIEEEPLAVTLSPDRTRTAFMRYSGTDWGVYVADSTRQNAHWIALVGRFYTEPPIWSPTGTHLAFVAFRNGTSDLYVVNSDGTGSPARLTFSRAIDTFPRWRPVPQSLSELTLQ